jgi:hypothetical protein
MKLSWQLTPVNANHTDTPPKILARGKKPIKTRDYVCHLARMTTHFLQKYTQVARDRRMGAVFCEMRTENVPFDNLIHFKHKSCDCPPA